MRIRRHVVQKRTAALTPDMTGLNGTGMPVHRSNRMVVHTQEGPQTALLTLGNENEAGNRGGT
jgi:hypothetical protein